MFLIVSHHVQAMPKKLIEKVELAIQYQAVKFIAQVLYLAGLTLLLPMWPLIFTPELFQEVQMIFFLAGGLIIASFLTVLWFTKSKKKAAQTLGFITLIPGLAAVIFAALGTQWLLAQVPELSPFIQAWILKFVPTSWFVAGMYIILGTGLVWYSQR